MEKRIFLGENGFFSRFVFRNLFKSDKNFINVLLDVYIGIDYKLVFDFEKYVEEKVFQYIVEMGVFCFFNFVKQGVNIWFVVDNIDFLEDILIGQNIFYGKVIVLKQCVEDGEIVKKNYLFIY